MEARGRRWRRSRGCEGLGVDWGLGLVGFRSLVDVGEAGPVLVRPLLATLRMVTAFPQMPFLGAKNFSLDKYSGYRGAEDEKDGGKMGF